MKTVRDLLKQHDGTLWHVRPDNTVFEALQTLARLEAGALLVLDGEGRLVGVFSERDYTRKVALQGRNSHDMHVSDIMTAEVITVGCTARTHECMALMRARKIRHLPVLDGDKVLGMISIRDLMNDIIEDHEATIAQLHTYIHS